jgi:hypothetical protein
MILWPDDDPLRGSKHVASIKLYNIYSIFQYSCVQRISIILFNTYTTGMAPLKFWVPEFFVRDKGPGLKLTPHFHLVLRLNMHVAVTPLPTHRFCGVKLINFTTIHLTCNLYNYNFDQTC